ncbi:C6 transcription factor [Botrytis cinerea]
MDPASLSLLQSAVHDEEQRDLAMGELSGAQLSQPQSPGAKSKKRKSIDGGETAVPEKKKRSSIACTNCRSRKVRCDVERSERVNDAGERVCNNCAIDGIQCLVPGSKRRRTKRGSADVAAEAVPLQAYTDGIAYPPQASNNEIRRASGPSAPSQSQHIHQSALHSKEVDSIDGQKLAQLAHRASMTGDLVRTPFVDMESLKRAGHRTRKAARKAFFQRARVLYDLDYENDMLTVVQSLLLMTYWYETPEDHKDTWHWMGRAIDHAYTLALHRDPKGIDADHKLRKRVWWSCFMRDRLIALGMRRPTRVKDEDCDVPMLVEGDFEIKALDPRITIISSSCSLIRDVEAQRELALMCISKAELCLCISQILVAQYSVLGRHQGVSSQSESTTSQIMLFPKKSASSEEVEQCDLALDHWKKNLPQACVYSNELRKGNSGQPLFVACSLLHMIYFTATSALHRPRVLPAGPNQPEPQTLFALSREVVTNAAIGTTNIVHDMHNYDLERYLPTTGVTALLPAIIIHLLLVRSPQENERQPALEGFCLCMTVLESLRDNYSSADYATQFLEAAVRKAGMEDIIGRAREAARREDAKRKAALAYEKKRAQLERAQRSMDERITPPVDTQLNGFESLGTLVDSSTAIYNGHFAHSPPDSDAVLGGTGSKVAHDPNDMFEFLDINYNDGGESGGFYDMDLFSREIPGFGSRMPSPQPGDNLALFDQPYMDVLGI